MDTSPGRNQIHSVPHTASPVFGISISFPFRGASAGKGNDYPVCSPIVAL